MPTDPLPQRPLPAHVADIVVQAIQDAYRENQDVQVVELGHGDWNYSLDVYTTIKYFLRERLHGEGVVVEDGNSLWLECGGCRFFIHKVGRTGRDDPWQCFPKHSGPAGHAAQLQLAFDIDVELAPPRVWVICHYGSLEDGACAVRLQASGAADADKIKSWVQVHDLWLRPDEGVVSAGADVPEPPPVDVDDPAIELKGPSKQQSSEVDS